MVQASLLEKLSSITLPESCTPRAGSNEAEAPLLTIGAEPQTERTLIEEL